MSFDPKLLQLYAVTDRQWTGRQTLIQQLEAALQGGVTLVQLREKDLDDAAFLAEAREVVALCHRYGVPCLINDNLPVALAAGADGSMGQEDQPVADIRRQVGPDFLIGATADPGPGPGCPGPRRGGLPGGWGLLPLPHQTQRQGDHPGGAGGYLRRRLPPGGGHWGNHPPECPAAPGGGDGRAGGDLC